MIERARIITGVVLVSMLAASTASAQSTTTNAVAPAQESTESQPIPAGVGAGTNARDPDRWQHTLIEIGPIVSAISAGAEGEVAFPLTRSFRFGVMAAANALFPDISNCDVTRRIAPERSRTDCRASNQAVFAGALELRRVGHGVRHFDSGLLGGVAETLGTPVAFAGMRLGLVWERAASGISVSIVPNVIFSATQPLPGIWAAFRWELPL